MSTISELLSDTVSMLEHLKLKENIKIPILPSFICSIFPSSSIANCNSSSYWLFVEQVWCSLEEPIDFFIMLIYWSFFCRRLKFVIMGLQLIYWLIVLEKSTGNWLFTSSWSFSGSFYPDSCVSLYLECLFKITLWWYWMHQYLLFLWAISLIPCILFSMIFWNSVSFSYSLW